MTARRSRQGNGIRDGDRRDKPASGTTGANPGALDEAALAGLFRQVTGKGPF